jgi:hypothetical protein
MVESRTCILASSVDSEKGESVMTEDNGRTSRRQMAEERVNEN